MKELLQKTMPHLTGAQLDAFDRYYRLLLEWNERMNLTAITAPEEVVQKHFADSLMALPYLPKGVKGIDVGTGAGFPGIPLLIVRPDLQLTLCDSLQKRLGFLDTVLRELGLKAELLHARAEELGQNPAYRGAYEITLTRAVSRLSVLAELTVPLLKTGGTSICYKGAAAAELSEARRALELLHARARVIPIPCEWGERTLVLLQKTAPTPKAYPRRAGIPQKEPL